MSVVEQSEAASHSQSEWLSRFTRVSPVGIFRCEVSGKCVYVNDRWCELTGFTAKQAMGEGWRRAVHPKDQDRVFGAWKRSVEKLVPFRDEFRYLRPDGSIVWGHVEVGLDRNEQGLHLGFVGSVSDVTELRRIREELETAHKVLEQRVRERTEKSLEVGMVVEQMQDPVIRMNASGTITGWNRAAEQLFGYTPAEILGKSMVDLVPQEERQAAKRMKTRVLAGESIRDIETVRKNKRGDLIVVEIAMFPLRTAEGEILGMSAILRDLTERKRAERRVRQLSYRLQKTQDEVGRRIAREMHDSTAQLLAALSINISQLCQPERPLSEQRRQQMLEECAAFADRALLEIRTQSYLLHPPMLDERGLVAALGFFIEGFSKRSGISVDFRPAPRADQLSEVARLALFRVVQEALNNVHRHSGSLRADITLEAEGGSIKLTIRDYGQGSVRDIEASMGVGIGGMRERVEQIGGRFAVSSASPGIRIAATIPLETPV